MHKLNENEAMNELANASNLLLHVAAATKRDHHAEICKAIGLGGFVFAGASRFYDACARKAFDAGAR